MSVSLPWQGPTDGAYSKVNRRKPSGSGAGVISFTFTSRPWLIYYTIPRFGGNAQNDPASRRGHPGRAPTVQMMARPAATVPSTGKGAKHLPTADET